MNDWLHCNKCSIKVQPDIKMYLVECAHVFCEKCIQRVGDEKCLVCQKSNNFILIGKDMHSSAQPFFVPFEVQMKKIIEVYNFQMLHRQRLNQAQAEKYQYAKGQLFSCYNKLKGAMSENKMMRNMLLNNNRNCHPNAGGFITSTPSVINDDISDFTPLVQKSKQMPGFAQRIQKYNGNNMRGMLNQQNQSSNRNVHANPGFVPSNSTMINDDNISQIDCGTEVSMPICTPVIEKGKNVAGYSQRFQNYGGNLRGMPIPHNQPHLHSGGMYYRPSPDSTAHHRRLNMAGVHGDHIPPNTSTSMRELQGKRT